MINTLNIADTDILNSEYGTELFAWFAYENPDAVLLSRLRAQKWDVKKAIENILNLLRWRIKWGVSELLAKGESCISLDEVKIGKGYFMGQDRAGRPVCYIHAKEHIRGQYTLENTEKLAVLALEMCRKLLKPPIETFTVVIDVNGLGMENIDLQVSRNFINLLQNYYPESLGLGIIVNASWIFYSCWAIVHPWLDLAVQSKIKFLKKESDLVEYIDPIHIPQRLQGEHANFQYMPPTDEDEKMISAFRNDHQGKLLAEINHRQAATEYLEITLRWAQNEDNQTVTVERNNAYTNLSKAYENLVPYITTRIHYHRTKDIDEPIFDIAYKKLQTTNLDDVAYF